jgi:hypothetical protein
MYLLTLIITPNATDVNSMDVPPLLIKGNVNPVTGNKLTATAMFINAWSTNEKLNPTAINAPNALGLRNTIRMALYKKNIYNINIIKAPIKPYSSAIIA